MSIHDHNKRIAESYLEVALEQIALFPNVEISISVLAKRHDIGTATASILFDLIESEFAKRETKQPGDK